MIAWFDEKLMVGFISPPDVDEVGQLVSSASSSVLGSSARVVSRGIAPPWA